MGDIQTLDLGKIMETAAALKAAQRQEQTDQLRNRVLAAQATETERQANQASGVDQYLSSNPNASLEDLSKFGLTGVDAATKLIQARGANTIEHNRQLYVAANTVANSDDPATAVQQVAPQFPQQYDSVHGQGAFAALTPDQMRAQAKALADHALTGLIDPTKQFEATQQMVQEHYKQQQENARAAAAQAGQDRRSNARITAENTRAGFGSGGQLDPKFDSTVQAILDYRQAPYTGRSAATGLGGQIMAEVNRRDPAYDATTFPAKSAALKSLMAGKDGQTLDSVNTAVQHLSQLRGLLQALNTGDIQVINQAKQAYQTATGNAAPTNAAVVANMASGEVNKVVTGSPGAQEDRDLSRAAVQLKGSPEQQQGAMDQIIGLMAGRLNGTRNRFVQAKLGPTFDNMMLPETKAALAAHGYNDSGAPSANHPAGKVLVYDPATGTFK